MREEEPTPNETAFVQAVRRRVPEVQDWYHHDADGLWVIVSLDLPIDGVAILETWRCDFDGKTLHGGRSPGFLNWDDGVRADAANIDFKGPLGLNIRVDDLTVAANQAASWFIARMADSG